MLAPPASVLMALQVPIPRLGLTSGVMFNRMVDQLRLAQTRVIIFEEASHLVEAGARVPPRAAGREAVVVERRAYAAGRISSYFLIRRCRVRS